MLTKIYPYGCLTIDCNWGEWFNSLQKSIYVSEHRSDISKRISSYFSDTDNVIVTICVRTAFDFFLTALNLPSGSEVVISSINIPEMTRIIRMHGLIPVPVDIHIETLVTPVDRLEAAITKHTKLIVVTMLYGVTFDITEISKIAQKKKIPIFEDCAECYCGNSFKGSDTATATVLSFGPIKTSTGFGGGIIIVRDLNLLSKMRKIHSTYPVQPAKVYFKKVLKYSLAMMIANSTSFNGFSRIVFHQLGIDYKAYVVKLLRGFPSSTGLEIYHFQPCAGLLSFLSWRLSILNDSELLMSMEKLRKGTEILTTGNVVVPGALTYRKVFWLYPIIVKDANRDCKILNDSGIDAYQGISQLNKIDPPIGSSYQEMSETNQMFSNLLYLPLHKDVPEKVIESICMKVVELLNHEPKI